MPNGSGDNPVGMDLVRTLRQQAGEIARNGHTGWDNTMMWAAAELELLRRPDVYCSPPPYSSAAARLGDVLIQIAVPYRRAHTLNGKKLRLVVTGKVNPQDVLGVLVEDKETNRE